MHGAWLASYVALWGLIILETTIFLAVLRQVGVLHTRIGPRGAMADATPAIGDILTDSSFRSLTGTMVPFRSAPGQTLLALFVNPSCAVCGDVVPGFQTLLRERALNLAGLVAIAADVEDARTWARDHRVKTDVVASPNLLKRLGIPSTPFGVTLDSDGKVIAAGLVNNLEQLESLTMEVPIQTELEAAVESLSVRESRNGKEARAEQLL